MIDRLFKLLSATVNIDVYRRESPAAQTWLELMEVIEVIDDVDVLLFLFFDARVQATFSLFLSMIARPDMAGANEVIEVFDVNVLFFIFLNEEKLCYQSGN